MSWVQIPVPLFVHPDLFFEFLCLRDPDHIYNDFFQIPVLIEYGIDAMQEVLDYAFAVLGRFRPFDGLPGATGFFENHPPGSCHRYRAIGKCAILFVGLPDHPLPDNGVRHGHGVRVQKAVFCIRNKDLSGDLVENFLKKVAF
jgi:hypothetical protein